MDDPGYLFRGEPSDDPGEPEPVQFGVAPLPDAETYECGDPITPDVVEDRGATGLLYCPRCGQPAVVETGADDVQGDS